jgi:hypothetical protein
MSGSRTNCDLFSIISDPPSAGIVADDIGVREVSCVCSVSL